MFGFGVGRFGLRGGGIGRVGVETCAIARAPETPTGLGAAALGEARRMEINSRMPPSSRTETFRDVEPVHGPLDLLPLRRAGRLVLDLLRVFWFCQPFLDDLIIKLYKNFHGTVVILWRSAMGFLARGK